MNWKRFLSLTLCLLVVLATAACGGTKATTGKKVKKKKPTKKPSSSVSEIVDDNNSEVDSDYDYDNNEDYNYDDNYDDNYDNNHTSDGSTDYDDSNVLPIRAGEDRKVTVSLKDVINKDFLGLGSVCIPTTLMSSNLKNGYNNAYWELEKKRISILGQKIVRIWFQIDWFESDKGVYNWNSEKMQAFYKYMDLFKELGTEVSLNFSWKNGRAIQSWYPIKGVDPATSAPQDVEHYAKDVSLALHELIEVRGYNNLKYIHYYNEPSGYDDFRTPGANEEYFAVLANAVHKQLVKDGRRNLVKIWGPEIGWQYNSTIGQSWAEFFMKKATGTIDIGSFHAYEFPEDTQAKNFKQMKISMAGLPIVIGEYGWADAGKTGWDQGFANYVINGANNGISGLAAWQMHGCWCEDPQEWANLSTGNFNLWNAPQVDMKANQSYYEVGLLTRYIPAHSNVLKTEVDSGDVRATTFRQGDDYTVIVEFKELKRNRKLTLDFGKNINKTFYKFVGKSDAILEENALLPACSGKIKAGNSLTDKNVSQDYHYIVYTTIKPQTQVAFEPVRNTVGRGEKVQLKAKVIDNSDGLVWSVASGKGKVSQDGVFTPAKDSRPGQMIAVKATSSTDPTAYGIALITIE